MICSWFKKVNLFWIRGFVKIVEVDGLQTEN